MHTTGTAWTKPKIIAIVRQHPEEALMQPCKFFGFAAMAPMDFDGGCYAEACGECWGPYNS